MTRDGSRVRRVSGPPPGVADRLAVLRALHVPQRDLDARARLARERPRTEEAFAVAVDRRLRELRALCELANHLRQGRMAERK